jgi:hypothetical protein
MLHLLVQVTAFVRDFYDKFRHVALFSGLSSGLFSAPWKLLGALL